MKRKTWLDRSTPLKVRKGLKRRAKFWLARGSRLKAKGRRGQRERKRQKPWADAIKERDCWTCRRCGSRKDVQAHHLRTKELGGPNTDANGVTLCERCHQGVHARWLPDWKEWLAPREWRQWLVEFWACRNGEKT